MGIFFLHDDPFFDEDNKMDIIIPNSFLPLTVLEKIDLRLTLFLKYIDYMSDIKIRNYTNKKVYKEPIGNFEQWLCYNRYGSLAIEEEWKGLTTGNGRTR